LAFSFVAWWTKWFQMEFLFPLSWVTAPASTTQRWFRAFF
jgi:hypothetical protein